MVLGLCQCTYPAFFYDPSSPVVVTIELLVISLIVTICAIVNYKFRKKLKEEKRRRPLGRKGNVVEPLMSWYCIIIIFGTTYILLLHWQYVNEIIPFYLIPEWLCVLLTTLERCIVSSILYNSMLIVLIRYVYIVHQQKANMWDFERVGKLFQYASIIVPTGMELVHLGANSSHVLLTKNTLEIGKAKFEGCNNSFGETNSTLNTMSQNDSTFNPTFSSLIPDGVVLAAYYFYVVVSAVVFLNIVEGFLYIKIFKCIKR